MSLSYTTTDGQTLIVPGAYAEAQVVSTPSTLAANGILMVIGEANSGPDFTLESDLSKNTFGPDQQSDIIAKYGSGRLVDAFVGAVSASNDNNIMGSFTSFVPVKTNVSVQASGTLTNLASGVYSNVVAIAGGANGNLITTTVTSPQGELSPSTGSFILASPQVATTVSAVVNGGAVVTSSSMSAGATPATLVTDLSPLTGVTVTGGAARGLLNSTVAITLGNVNGYQATFTITTAATNWHVAPSVGDILYIGSGSGFTSGGHAGNAGTYVVQAVSSNTLTALKVIDISGTGVTRTAPVGVSDASTTSSDIEAYLPVNISVTNTAVVPGLGKSLELANTSTGSFANLCWTYNTSTQTLAQATFVSVSGTPVVIVSSEEYQVDLNVVLQKTGVSENWTAGGGPVLSIGYQGTTAQAVISNGVMTVTLSGGSSAALSPIVVTLSNYPTIGDLCQYFSSLGGFTAAPTLATYSQLSSTYLDPGTFNINTVWGAQTGRIKTDGYDFLTTVNGGSTLVNLVPTGTQTALIGLPNISSLAFLSGGSKGFTTNAIIQNALNALQAVKGNLLVPLFSNDATVDIAAGFTDPNSTYTIASINTAVRAHVLQMSQLKRHRRRIAILSNYDTFANNQNNAANIASSRCCMTFQSVQDNNAQGTLTTFRPWMTAIKAAAMQAAGVYKDITWKYTTVSSATVPLGGFNYNIESNLESALGAGLLPLFYDGSGWSWVSDQTTYSVDNNFVYNSLQAMYCLDMIMNALEQRMSRAFVGQSLADVSATTAVTVFKAICDDLITQKLIAPSDDAPRGVKNIVIKIVNGNAMVVGAEVKEATSLKFVAIQLLVSAIQQTATG